MVSDLFEDEETELLSLRTTSPEGEGEGGYFEVDGERYVLYSADEVSRENEAEMLVLFQKMARLGNALSVSQKDEEIAKATTSLRDARTRIIVLFTNMEAGVAAKLGYRSQMRLLDVISKDLQKASDEVNASAKDAEAVAASLDAK